MPALENRRHELFAQALARGETATAAYAAAGYAPNDGNAIRLKGNERISTRVAELQERSAIKVEMTAMDIVDMLREDRELAHKIEQPSAAVSAAMGMAKLLGFVKDKTELTGKDGNAIEIDQKVREDADAVTSAIAGLAARARAAGVAGETQH
jgi:phage terminase small subunit